MVVTFNNFLRFSQKCTYHTSLFPAEVSVPFEASTLLPEFSIAICIKELPVPTAEILEAFPNLPTIRRSTAPYAACRINAPSTGIANRSKD